MGAAGLTIGAYQFDPRFEFGPSGQAQGHVLPVVVTSAQQGAIDPRQFAAAWLGSFAILVLAGPVFAWWGFALTLKFYFQL
jgi:hypothetical protein